MHDKAKVVIDSGRTTTTTVDSYEAWLMTVLTGPIEDTDEPSDADGWHRAVVGFMPDDERVSVVFQDLTSGTRVVVVIPTQTLSEERTKDVYDFVVQVPRLLLASADEFSTLMEAEMEAES